MAKRYAILTTDKKVETINQKTLGSNRYVCRCYSGGTGRGPFWWGLN